MKKNTLLYASSGLLSTALLAYTLLNLDWQVLRESFSELRWGWLGMALLAYLINIGLRALRFANLIYSRSINWFDLVPVSALHNILTYLMPAKTGDVTYIIIAKNRLGLPLIEGTATLLAARFYDFFIVALMLAALLPLSGDEMPVWILQSAAVFCSAVIFGALGIFAFLRSAKPSSDANSKKASQKGGLSGRIRVAWNKFFAGLREIQDHGAHTKTLLLTTGIWLSIYLNFYSATQSMGLAVSFHHIVIISIVMIPLTLLPVQGFANIGTHEVGWTSVLVAFQYPYETALAIAAGSHFVLLISVLTAGSAAFIGAKYTRPLIVKA